MKKNLFLLVLLITTGLAIAACTPKQQQEVADIIVENKLENAEAPEDDDSMLGGDKDPSTTMQVPAPGVDPDKVDEMIVNDGEMIDNEKTTGKDEPISFSGTVLAGSSSPLLEFNQADYNKALASDKLVMLYFYANWCPICKAEFPKMQQAFNQLSGSDVVGFRVSFNDTETTEQEEALAKQFGVAYQHTKVALRNGQRVLKAPDSWDTQRYLDEINQLTN